MAKKSKNLLPKKIAGVKVPKKVRKGRFGELLASRTGQALIAEAIMAAGAIAGAKKAADNPKTRDALGNLADKVKETGGAAGNKTSETTGMIAYALGEAARSFADALHRDRDEPKAAGWEAPAPEPQAKKKTSAGMEPRPL